MEEPLVTWAQATAKIYLRPLGRRWVHVSAVGQLAERIAPAFGEEAPTLVAAAYLHDVGYANALAVSGFHSLDGGRFVRAQGREWIRIEAELRGIDGYCDEFGFDDGPLDHALTFCDLTTGPDGSRVSLAWRVAEITARYGPDSVTAQAITAGLPEFERACRQTEQRVAAFAG